MHFVYDILTEEWWYPANCNWDTLEIRHKIMQDRTVGFFYRSACSIKLYMNARYGAHYFQETLMSDYLCDN